MTSPGHKPRTDSAPVAAPSCAVLLVRDCAQHPRLRIVPDRPSFGVNVDLVAMQRHLVIRHLHYLGLEQWRDEIAWHGWNSHIEQPRLTNVTSVCAALGPIFDH